MLNIIVGNEMRYIAGKTNALDKILNYHVSSKQRFELYYYLLLIK